MKLMFVIVMSSIALWVAPNQQVVAGGISNAVDVCQGSLPSFEGSIRKRPLAIANEGVAVSFVSCSLVLTYTDNELDAFNKVRLLVVNRSAQAQDVACTLVDGTAASFTPAPVYQPQTVSVGAGGGTKVLEWSAAVLNENGDPYILPNLNCALPPGVEMNALETS